MIDPDEFEGFARDIAAANGISLETARDYARRIGDTPELDETGKLTIVRDREGRELARVIVPTSDDDEREDS